MEQQELFNEKEDKSLLAAFGWWEKRRIIYNFVVGATGLGCLFIFEPPFFNQIDVPGIITGVIIYGIIANLFFTLGFIVEVAAKHYFKSKMDFTERRKSLFIVGLLFSILITIGLAYVFLLMTVPHPS